MTHSRAAASSRAGQSRPARWIQAAPVIIVLAEQCRLLDRTFLHDYYFH